MRRIVGYYTNTHGVLRAWRYEPTGTEQIGAISALATEEQREAWLQTMCERIGRGTTHRFGGFYEPNHPYMATRDKPGARP